MSGDRFMCWVSSLVAMAMALCAFRIALALARVKTEKQWALDGWLECQGREAAK